MNSHIFHIATFMVFLLFAGPLFAQESRLYEKAEENFQDRRFTEAFKHYLELSRINPRYEDTEYKLEICALLTSAGDDRPLDRFLGFENTYGKSDDHYFYWLGQIHTRRYNIADAIYAFEKFQRMSTYSGISDEESTKELLAHSMRLKEYFENPDNYEIHQLETPINSSSAELSPVFFEQEGELLFASNRSGSGEKPFSIYYTRKNGDTWEPIVKVPSLGSFTRNNANIEVVNEDGKLFLFNEANGGDLFYSEPEGKNWSNLVEFDSKVSNNHLASHFFINEHEDRIIFASDENEAGLDIYETFKDPSNGKWSKPSPFYSSINSSFNEDSPYLSPDESKLFFCSDRPGGVGGYDVYVSEYDTENFSWSEPVNMGWPVNSPNDEFHFKMNADQTSGYFVSNRLHSKGDYDIYFFWHVDKVKVEGRIFDNSVKGPLANAEVRFHPLQYLDEYFSSKTDQSGRYSTKVISNETFRVEILKDGKIIYNDEFEVYDTGGELTTHIKDFSVN